MKLEKRFDCPKCGRIFEDQTSVHAHLLHQHPVQPSEWTYCEICGAGWNCKAYGYNAAVRAASDCEMEHLRNGNAEDIAAITYFGTKGRHGRIRVVKGGRA